MFLNNEAEKYEKLSQSDSILSLIDGLKGWCIDSDYEKLWDESTIFELAGRKHRSSAALSVGLIKERLQSDSLSDSI